MKTNKYLAFVLSTVLFSQSVFPVAASSVSNTNAPKAESKVVLNNEYSYKVKFPGVIDLKLDKNSDYSDKYTVTVFGQARGMLLNVVTDDITMSSDNDHEYVVTNGLRRDENDTLQKDYIHDVDITEEGSSFEGFASLNSDNVQTGSYTGIASFKFKLVEHKHTYKQSTAPDYRGTAGGGTPYQYTGYIWQRDGDEQYLECEKCHKRKTKEVNKANINFNDGSSHTYLGETSYWDSSAIIYYNYPNNREKQYSRTTGNSADPILLPLYFRYNGEWYKTDSLGSDTGYNWGTHNTSITRRIVFDGTKADFEKITKKKKMESMDWLDQTW